MASEEEKKIHAIWLKGFDLVDKCLTPIQVTNSILKLKRSGMSAQEIAAAFEVNVEEVEHDITLLEEATALMKESNRQAALWIKQNGASPLLEGYDE